MLTENAPEHARLTTESQPAVPEPPYAERAKTLSLGLHRLACYLMRAQVNLTRLRYVPESNQLVYEPKTGHDTSEPELVDPLEFLARVLIRIPEPTSISFISMAVPRHSLTLTDAWQCDDLRRG